MFGGTPPETDLFPGFFHAQVLEIFFLPGEKGYTLPAADPPRAGGQPGARSTTSWWSTRCSIHHELVVNQVLDPPRAGGQPGARSTTSWWSTSAADPSRAGGQPGARSPRAGGQPGARSTTSWCRPVVLDPPRAAAGAWCSIHRELLPAPWCSIHPELPPAPWCSIHHALLPAPWCSIHHALLPAPWCSTTTPWRSTRCSIHHALAVNQVLRSTTSCCPAWPQIHHELLPAPWCSTTTPWRSTRCSIHHELPPSLAADPPRPAAGALVLDHHALAVNQVLDPPRAAAQPGRRSTTSCCWRPGARSVQTSAQTAHQRLGVVDSAHMGVKKPAKRLVF